jgi:hypothetical protein
MPAWMQCSPACGDFGVGPPAKDIPKTRNVTIPQFTSFQAKALQRLSTPQGMEKLRGHIFVPQAVCLMQVELSNCRRLRYCC